MDVKKADLLDDIDWEWDGLSKVLNGSLGDQCHGTV